MILSSENTLLQDIAKAKANGFTEDFMYSENTIIARQSKRMFGKTDCTLVEYCRHEGMSDVDDASILFLIACADGTRGCLSSAYGKDADIKLIEFVMALKKDNK